MNPVEPGACGHRHPGRPPSAGTSAAGSSSPEPYWSPPPGSCLAGSQALSVGALLIAGACIAWGFDNGVTAKIDQLSPEHVVLLKGFIAGSANLMLGVTVGAGLGGLHQRR